MPIDDRRHDITRIDQLVGLFDAAGEASLRKETATIHAHYRRLIEASPFAILATSGPDGLDASPRGDPPGFVVVHDDRTLLMPERRGNNRIDSLRNIVIDPRVGLLFLIPGHGETLRVNGRARITAAPDLLDRFVMQGRPPKCVVVIDVDTVYFQCARAILRSRLWDPASRDGARGLPSAGSILAAVTDGSFDGATYDRELPGRQRDSLY